MPAMRILRPALLLTVGAWALSACSTMTPQPRLASLPDQIRVGREAGGEPCTANWAQRDSAASGDFAQRYNLTCRSVTASRAVGAVRLVYPDQLAQIDAIRSCGAESPATLPGIADATARRCRDQLLDAEVLVLRGTVGDRMIDGAALSSAAGPLVEAMRRVAGQAESSDIDGDPKPAPVAYAELAAAPGVTAPEVATTDFDPGVALAQGIRLNHKGLHLEASRLLNDAVSRLTASVAAPIRAELFLEAGLADSNISFRESASQHFARADELMAGNITARSDFLTRKRDAYRALDLLNRREYEAALVALNRLGSGPVDNTQPLQDARNLQLLNQNRNREQGGSGAVAMPDFDLLSQLMIDASVNWARSVAYFALNRTAEAQRALDAARTNYEPLTTASIEQSPVLWLGARIDRQQGRISARQKDWSRSINSFDRALEGLRRGAIGTAGTGNEPVVAETLLERASVVARSGASAETVKRDYAQAVDAVIIADARGSILSFGVERYLDLLLADFAKGDAAALEAYFRTMQAIGEPAVARQLGQIQAEVTADPAIGVLVRDRADLEREITRLRYAISDAEANPQPGVSTADLNRQREVAETKLVEVSTKLAADARYSSVDESPLTIAGLRAALKQGEIYVKFSDVNGRLYALIVSGDSQWAHRVSAPSAKLAEYAAEMRRSIDGRLDEGALVPFRVDTAYVTFRLLTDKAYQAVASTSALVIDPAGPLDNLPASLLVTDAASAQAWAKAKGNDKFDFTQVKFLGRTASISTAMSPRSFLVARSLPVSRATENFLGFAQHQPITGDGAQMVEVGNACSVPLSRIAELSRELKPIARKEVEIAAAALGEPNAPLITGQSFTDLDVNKMQDLTRFKVLHFATHGLQEGTWGCNRSPPALVTSYGGAGSDGLLSFDEIARLRLDANLVVLSACDTSAGVKDESLARQSGQEEAGAKLEGLVRAFLTAKARAVMATYWRVSAEKDADLFVSTFYTNARDRPIGDALRAAQNALISQREFSHPFYWAPYFVVGDASKSLLGNTAVAEAPADSSAGSQGGAGQ